MIDTIILTLEHPQFAIIQPDLFSPSASVLFDNEGTPRVGVRSVCTQNGTKRQKQEGAYLPRLTISRRPCGSEISVMLKIEFSAPKLLLGNNFEELRDADFGALLTVLQGALLTMGVTVDIEVLELSRVSSIHFAKNIILTDGSRPAYYLDALQRTDVSKRLDVTKTQFRNEGHGFAIHANSFEIVFYDKLADLAQSRISEKRCFDKDNSGQLSVLNIRDAKIPFEVLRMEVRLAKRKKIRQVLSALNEFMELNLRGLFSSQISQRILSNYWQVLKARDRLYSPDPSPEIKRFFTVLAIKFPELGFAKSLQIYGLNLVLSAMSFRELKAIFPKANRRTLAKYQSAMDSLKSNSRNAISSDIVGQTLETMEAIRFSQMPDIYRAILKMRIV